MNTAVAHAHIMAWRRVDEALGLAERSPARALALVASVPPTNLGDDVLSALTGLWLVLSRQLAPDGCMLALHAPYRVVVERGPQPLTARVWSALGAPNLVGQILPVRALTDLRPLQYGRPPYPGAGAA